MITHRQYVQFKVQQNISSGFLSDLNFDNFTVATVDNIHFLQRHSFVFHGDQGRSWHGTTIQVVQPLAGKNQVYDNVESIAVAGQDQETVQHAELLNPGCFP